uniref:hypothetical protein n=1 Tax=Methanobrevibacter smithii TaxID=2173 RepID=UPI0037DD7C56
MKKIKVKLESQYNGHSIKKNGSVDMNFILPYSEIVNVVKLLQLINCNIHVLAKVGTSNPVSLGVFYLNKVNIDRDGQSKISFNTELESSEINNMTELTEPDTIIRLMCSGTIEDEDNEEDD